MTEQQVFNKILQIDSTKWNKTKKKEKSEKKFSLLSNVGSGIVIILWKY